MSDQEMNERARRNYALEAFTFDAENFLQIRCGGEVLVTVTAPTGAPDPEFYLVFNGTGLDEEDNDLSKEDAVKLFAARGDPQKAFRMATMFGYQHALAKMMTADEREEREAYGLVA